jgi:hypothetical protein
LTFLKGVIVTRFLAQIVGRHHYSYVNTLDHICGEFNAPALATACLVFVDEAMCGGNKVYAARMKTLISEPRHTIADKYASALSMESFTNFILSSNDDHVMEVEQKDRRYLLLETDNKYSGCRSTASEKQAYFDRLSNIPVELVADYLYQVDVSTFNPREVPNTDLQRTQKLLTLKPDAVDTWLLRCIERERLPIGEWDQGVAAKKWEMPRVKAAVYEHYCAHAGSRPKPGQERVNFLLGARFV